MATSSSFSLLRLLGRFARGQNGNVATIVAILIIPLVGVLALAGEISTWYTIDRSMQNASDAAAIAAARNADFTNDGGGLPRYQREAFAVASQYGFVSGTKSVTVTPTTVTCPSGNGTCFQVTISSPGPVGLSKIVGFAGNGSGGSTQTITAHSVATGVSAATTFCLMALGGTVSSGVLTNGTPKSNMTGCSIASNGDEQCNGNGLQATSDYAVDNADPNCTASGSGGSAHSGQSPFSDALDAGRAANLPSDPCGGNYPQEAANGGIASNLLSNSYTGGGVVQTFCGDVQLYTTGVGKKGQTTYSASTVNLAAGTTLVIFNGALDIPSGATLNGTGVTVIFTGGNTTLSTAQFYPIGGGDLNISAATGGAFAGVSVWQNPALPTQTLTYNGNSPTWNIEGMVYMPVTNLTITGAVSKNGTAQCFGLVVNTVVISGTGYIEDNNGCSTAGTTLPGVPGTIVALVQ